MPKHSITKDLRSATALQPKNYYKYIADGKIKPHHSTISSFVKDGLILNNGDWIIADTVVLSLGSDKPRFPFLPEKYRKLLESRDDGVQLYRHIIHPDIPRLAFAGYNHGFLHVPAVEVGAVWLTAILNGDLILPSKDEMKKAILHIQNWKRENISFEPSRSCAVNTRYQKYLDIMLKDLQLSPYRKSNIFSEVLGRYIADDYSGILDEYLKNRDQKEFSLKPADIWS